ncbi:MAG: SDR family oxidoreductase [Candidatus Devosia symbiotica]|nr:SDR family oxidoreductase [Candidatus Devosia symbiotica]
MPDLWVNTPFSLHGRLAIVTGASRGIGNAIAQGLAAAGAQVHGLSRSGQGGSRGVLHHACDLADISAAIRVVSNITDEHGVPHILVNAAGVSFPPANLMITDEVDRLNRTFAVNVMAAYGLCLAVAEHMQDGGSIINVTSINAALGFPDNPGYVASKAALAGLTRALAVDLAPRGIRVNALAPGYVHTDMTKGSFGNPEMHAARRSRTALGRWGKPEDMSGTAVFLASDASSYITGQQIFVDGGWTVQGLPS